MAPAAQPQSHSAQKLKVTFVYLGQAKKMVAFNECVNKAGVRKDVGKKLRRKP